MRWIWRITHIHQSYIRAFCMRFHINKKTAAITHKPTFRKMKCAIHSICWMLSLARKLISYTKQVSWLTDTNVCPPLLTCMIGLCNGILKTDSPNTVTGSLRTRTWFPLQRMSHKWNRKKDDLLHLILQYSITLFHYINLLLFCQWIFSSYCPDIRRFLRFFFGFLSCFSYAHPL